MDEANENCLYRVSAFVFKSDFVVTDSEDIEYLKLRNVGREIQVEVDNNEIVDLLTRIPSFPEIERYRQMKRNGARLIEEETA